MTDNEIRSVDIDKLFEDGTAIDEALRQGARDARKLHKSLGQPIAEWRDGKVVWIEPEDIVIDDSSSSSSSNAPEKPDR